MEITWLSILGAVILTCMVRGNHLVHHSGKGDNSWILRPEAGVYFKEVGLMNAYSNVLYLGINLKMPNVEIIDFDLKEINCSAILGKEALSLRYDREYYRRKYNLDLYHDDRKRIAIANQELRDRSNSGIELCEDYKETLRNFNNSLSFYRETVLEEIHDIHTLLGNKTIQTRNKRFFMPIIPFLVAAGKTALTLATTAISYVRHVAIMKSLESLNNQQKHMNDHVVHYKNKSALYNAYQDELMVNLHKRIKSVRTEVQNLANDTHRQLSLLSDRMETAKSSSIFLTNLLSKLQSHATTVLTKNLYYLSMHRSYIKHFLLGTVALRKGKLSPLLVGPNRLAQILKDTDKQVKAATGGTSRLLSLDPAHYYKRLDVTFILEGDNLLMQIPIPLFKESIGLIKLYQFQHIHVPYDTDKRQDKDFTSIRTPYSYLGIVGSHYTLMTENQVSNCKNFAGYIVCPHEILYIHESRPTCLHKLYTGYKLGEITKHCDIRLHRGTEMPPAILETPTNFLLSGFTGSWSLTCGGKELPTRSNGRGYALVTKESLCSCSLSSENLHLTSMEQACPKDNIGNLKLTYPVNALAWSIFHDIAANNSIPDINRLFDDKSPPPVSIPELHIFEEEKTGILLDEFTDKSIKIVRIKELLKQDAEMFLTEADKLSHKRKFVMWFRNLEASQIAMAILSMLGGLCTVIMFIFIFKHHALSGLVSSIAMHMPKARASSDLLADHKSAYRIKADIGLMDWLLMAASQALVVMIVLWLSHNIYKWLRTWGKSRRFIQPKDKFVGKGSRCIVMAEISDGIRVVMIYVATIRTHAAFLKYPNPEGEFPEIIDKDSGWFQDIIHIDWKECDVITLSSNERIRLPEFLTVNLKDKFILNKIITANHTVRVAIFCDAYLWYISHTDDARRQAIWFQPDSEGSMMKSSFRKAYKPLEERKEQKIRKEMAMNLGNMVNSGNTYLSMENDDYSWDYETEGILTKETNTRGKSGKQPPKQKERRKPIYKDDAVSSCSKQNP